jgi:hypothetical protein
MIVVALGGLLVTIGGMLAASHIRRDHARAVRLQLPRVARPPTLLADQVELGTRRRGTAASADFWQKFSIHSEPLFALRGHDDPQTDSFRARFDRVRMTPTPMMASGYRPIASVRCEWWFNSSTYR